MKRSVVVLPTLFVLSLLLPLCAVAQTIIEVTHSLQNGTIDIGTNQLYGSAFVRFSYQGRPSWVDNGVPDKGRQIQVSLYEPFSVDCWPCNNSSCAWGWNPVQAGNACNAGSGSTIVAHDSTHLVTRTQPLQWNNRYVPSRSNTQIQQSLTLLPAHPNAIQVDYEVTNSESFAIGNAASELPVAYLKPILNHAKAYQGSAPWTFDTPQDVTPALGHSNRLLTLAEPWVAWIGDDGVGLGMYKPTSFVVQNESQFFWDVGHLAPPGTTETVYLQHWSKVPTPPASRYNVRVYLIAGTLDQIRRVVYALEGRLPSVSVSNTSLPEGNTGSTPADFSVSLSAPIQRDVLISFATGGVGASSATPGGDYQSVSGVLTIPAGETSGNVTVPVFGDTTIETDETFALTLSAPINATLQQSQGTGTILNDDFPPPPIDAVFVGQGVLPATMNAGQTAQASITMRNMGTTTWTKASGFQLGSQNPQNNLTWGLNRVPLLDSDSIPRLSEKTFSFPVTAPMSTGVKNFQWQMVQNSTFFGQQSSNQVVTVTIPACVTPPTEALQFYPLAAPCRLLDTRSGGATPMASPDAHLYSAAGICGIPSTAKAVSVVLAAVTPTQFGHLRTSAGCMLPGSSFVSATGTLNFDAGRYATSNGTILSLSSGGRFAVQPITGTPGATVHLIVDANGYFAPAGAGGLEYVPLSAPGRLIDTRPGGIQNAAGQLIGGSARTYSAKGFLGISETAASLAGNAAVVQPVADGYLELYPSTLSTPPLVSNINYIATEVRGSASVTNLAPGPLDLKVYSSQNTTFIFDASGYFTPGAGSGSRYRVLTPCRLVNGVAIPGGADTFFAFKGGCNIPANAAAVAVNITVSQTAGPGYLVAYPRGLARPLAVHLNYQANQTISSHGLVTLSSTLTPDVAVFSLASATIWIDVVGYLGP
jgi:Calx-beta domain